MKKLTKEQQALLESALEELYSYLKRKFGIEYSGNIKCMVYEGVILINQCSFPKGVAWFADIVLDDRKIYVSTSKAELETIYSKREYDLVYMTLEFKLHTISF